MRRHPGMTLMELLTAAVIAALIGGVISAVIVVSLQTVFWRTSILNQEFPTAHATVNLITNEVYNAAFIYTPTGYTDILYVYRPKIEDQDTTLQAARVNKIPIAIDYAKAVEFYLSDATGIDTKTGTYLWRREFTQSGTLPQGTELNKRIIAKNVSTMNFNISWSQTSLVTRIFNLSSIALATTGKESGKTDSSVFNSTLTFRNPPIQANLPPGVITETKSTAGTYPLITF
jgi:hypothetical protein